MFLYVFVFCHYWIVIRWDFIWRVFITCNLIVLALASGLFQFTLICLLSWSKTLTPNDSPSMSMCRESCESEDATSLPSSHPSSPTENGTLTTETRSRPNAKSNLEENAYEDIVGKHTGSLALFSLDHLLVSVRPAGLLLVSYYSKLDIFVLSTVDFLLFSLILQTNNLLRKLQKNW